MQVTPGCYQKKSFTHLQVKGLVTASYTGIGRSQMALGHPKQCSHSTFCSFITVNQAYLFASEFGEGITAGKFMSFKPTDPPSDFRIIL